MSAFGQSKIQNPKSKIDLPVCAAAQFDPASDANLEINGPLLAEWLVAFLRDEIIRRRGFSKAVVGLSGGVDSAVTTYLCARALGPENVHVIRMPYKSSSAESLEHAQIIVDDLGVISRTIEITDAVDGYLHFEPD